MDIFARFWSKVDKNGPVPPHRPELGPCWIWTAAKCTGTGYGTFSIGGTNFQTHRLALAWELGRPLAAWALHRCDNRICVRGSHLSEGTHTDNMAERDARGRTLLCVRVGELNGRSKLDPQAVRDIRALAASGLGSKDIANRHNVGVSAVRSVLNRRTWAHVV